MGLKPVLPRVWRLTPAGQMNLNPGVVMQRAGAFGRSLGSGTVLLTRRDVSGLEHYLVAAPSSKTEQTMLALAQTVGARGEEVFDTEGLFDARAIVRLTVRGDGIGGRATQAGADPSEASRIVASTLRVGEWVAVSLRPFSMFERRRIKKWIRVASGSIAAPTHHSVQADALVMSMHVGADNPADARATMSQLVAALPGFDVDTKPRHVPVLSRGQMTAMSGFTAAGVIAALGAWLNVLPDTMTVFGPVGAVAGFIGTLVLDGTGIIPSPRRRLNIALQRGTLPAPERRLLPPPAVPASADNNTTRPGAYPLARSAFAVGPQMPVGLVVPHGTADSGPASTSTRTVPPAVTARIGPFIGTSLGKRIYLSARDLWTGVLILGRQGSGKTALLQALFGWVLLERQQPAVEEGWPGKNNVVVAFESKGAHSAQVYLDYADTAGDDPAYIDLADETSIAIDMLGREGTVEERARGFVNAMKYAFEIGDIRGRSFNTLTQVIAAGIVTTPTILRLAQQAGSTATDNASALHYAAHLLGIFGDASGVALATAIISEAQRPGPHRTPDLVYAAERLAQLYGPGRTANQRAQLVDAPLSKIADILTAEQWWSRPARITWEQVLHHNGVVVINTGTTRAGQRYDDELVRHMNGMLFYTLYDTIVRKCDGWRDKGRRISLFGDELALLCGNNAEVITWMHDVARAFGVEPYFASQRDSQLPPGVREAVLDFGIIASLRQTEGSTIDALIDAFSRTGGQWTSADIINLPMYEAIIRATVHNHVLAPFTAKIHDFQSNLAVFAAEQGYGDRDNR